MMYDSNNVFGKIISGAINAEKLYEDDKLIAIKDINPVAPVHILVLPKDPYIDFSDFVTKANAQDVTHYFKTVARIAKEQGAENYRLVSNKGAEAGQSVFHFHTHIIGGLEDLNLINKGL
jgi:histidine triad (HIT) family protein